MSSSTQVIKKLKLESQECLDPLSDLHAEEAVEAIEVEEDEEILDYFMYNLTPKMMEEARTQLNETDEVRATALQDLKLLLKKENMEKNLVCPMTDAFLLPFLRSRKFNVNRAFKLVQNYWKFRKEHRHIFDTSNSQRVKELILRNILGFLPHRDRNGSVVAVFKVGEWNPELDAYEEMFRSISAILIHSIQFPATQVCGYRVIFDARNLSWQQMKMCTPTNILLLIHSTQHCFPARYKGFHFLSENKLFNLLWAIIYPLLTKKLKKRIMLHGSNLAPLLDYIHPSVLPTEYGGTAGPFENSKWEKTIDENAENILDQLNYGYKS